MADFNKVFEKVIPNEGFYANLGADRGRETYMGISRRFHPNWSGWPIVDSFKAKNGGKIKHNYRIKDANLEKLVKDFYYVNFWKPKVQGDSILNFTIASNIFDMAINAPSSAVKIMQRALNTLGYNVAVDNKMGKTTIEAINKAPGEKLNKLYLEGRKAHYTAQAKVPGQAQFYDGWLARLNHFTDFKDNTAIISGLLAIGAYVFFLS